MNGKTALTRRVRFRLWRQARKQAKQWDRPAQRGLISLPVPPPIPTGNHDDGMATDDF